MMASFLLLAACGNAADMPVAAPGNDIVAGDAEGVVETKSLDKGEPSPQATQPSLQVTELFDPKFYDIPPDSRCHVEMPMTLGAQRVYREALPGPRNGLPSAWPSADEAEAGGEAYLAPPFPYLDVDRDMTRNARVMRMNCFYMENEQVDLDRLPSFMTTGDDAADSLYLFRKGGNVPYWDAEEVAIAFQGDRVVWHGRAIYCDDLGSFVGALDRCPVMLGDSPSFDGYADIGDGVYEPGPSRPQLYRGQPKSDAESSLMAYLTQDAGEVEGHDGKPVVSQDTSPEGYEMMTFERTGYMDDSLAGERFRLAFMPDPNEGAVLRYAGVQRLCRRGGSDDWTTEMCP